MRRPILVAVAGVVILAGIMVWLSAAQTRAVAIGDPIRQDDFTYTVTGFSRSSDVGLGRDAVRADGVFYVVSIKVENDAKVVDFRWDPSIAQLTDENGRRYQFSVVGQRALDSARPASLVVPAGQSQTFLVAFDLPKDVRDPSVAFSNGILMGDVFDFGAYARARVPLE